MDWAVRKLSDGEDGPNLRILAGLTTPFDYFETIRIVDAALADLGVERADRAEEVSAYAAELLTVVVESKMVSAEVLAELAELCSATNYLDHLMPFYLLHFAR